MTGKGFATVAYVHEPTVVGYNWHRSYLKLVVHTLTTEASVVRGDEIPVKYPTGGLIEARNSAVDKFLETDNDWLFWIDTDMGFDGDIVDRLVEVADPETRPVVGALCFTRREVDEDGQNGKLIVPHPTIYMWAQTPAGQGFVPYDDYPRGEVVACNATGSAALVIHRTVFEKINETHHAGNPYGLIANPDGGAFSEDLSFCLRLAELGIPVHIHTGVKTNHLKEVWLSEETFDVFRAAAEAVPWVDKEMVKINRVEQEDELAEAFERRSSA